MNILENMEEEIDIKYGKYGGGDRYQVYYCRDCDSNFKELIEP